MNRDSCIFFLIAGMIMATVGLGMAYIQNIIVTKCDTPVMATVVAVERSYGDITSPNHKKRTPTYFPIYSYEVDGVVYTVKSHSGTNPPRCTVGDIVQLKYDSDNPQTFSDGADSTVMYVLAGIGVVGVGVMVACVVGLIFTHKRAGGASE